jgi:hypothetical protein
VRRLVQRVKRHVAPAKVDGCAMVAASRRCTGQTSQHLGNPFAMHVAGDQHPFLVEAREQLAVAQLERCQLLVA